MGGAEQVLWALDQALAASGHRSIVIACEGSTTAGTLIPLPGASDGPLDAAARARGHAALRQALREAARDADLVHLHGVDFPAYLPPADVPALVTLHLPPEFYPPGALQHARPGLWFNCVSWAQHGTVPAGLNLVPPIPNGVPVDALGAAPQTSRGYALMLGRICPEKGQHLALQAAHEADASLLLCGTVFPYPEHRAYFEASVRPLLDRRRRYLGPVGFARKRRLLSAAACLLVPSLCAETSSLVAMEALACGTPVIARPVGALPEVVDHGRTGFLADTVPDLAAAIRAAPGIDRAVCRRTAGARFALHRMTDAYLSLYRDLAACRSLA